MTDKPMRPRNGDSIRRARSRGDRHGRLQPCRLRRAAFPVLGLLFMGCKCDVEERKPYTPFGVASSAEPAAAPSADAAASSTGSKPFEPRAAQRFDPPEASVEVQGVALRAPAGQLIAQVLLAQATTGSEEPESVTLAWLVPKERTATTSPGGLWRWADDGANKELVGFPQFVPTSADCTQQVELAQTGPSSLTLDVSAACPPGGIPRAPTRALHLLRLDAGGARTLQQLRLADAPDGEKLSVAVETTDQDGDGHDDAKVTFTLLHEGTERESSASLIWLDRAAGLARDDAEPQKSFADIGSIEVVRSKGKNTSARVAERLDNARRLYAYLCSESGTHRITDADGVAVSCGDLSRAFQHFRLAELRAALTLGQHASAVSVLDRADWYGTQPSEKERAALEKELFAQLPVVATRRTPVRARARAEAPEPRRSPLAFDVDGNLLVQGPAGITRVSADGSVSDASEEVDPWPLIIFGAGGRQATGLSYPCDETQVSVLARGAGGRLSSALKTDWLSPRPGACGGARFRRPELRVIHWAGDELVAIIGAELFGSQTRAPLGGPVSPNAKWRVHTTSVGLLVVGPSRTQLWRSQGDESECVIASDGARVACLTGAEPVMIEPSKSSEGTRTAGSQPTKP